MTTIITMPNDVNITNVQELAAMAWRSAKNEITVDGVTVRIRKLSSSTRFTCVKAGVPDQPEAD